MNKSKLIDLSDWVKKKLKNVDLQLKPLAGDASVRQYFRVKHENNSYIAVYAPIGRIKNKAFVSVAKTFLNAGLNVPKIIAQNMSSEFMLISDLGDRLYLQELNRNSVDTLYTDAFFALIKIQECRKFSNWQLPKFDEELILTELNYFKHWFLEKFLRLQLSPDLSNKLDKLFHLLVQKFNQQPQVCVHRDFHSRNLIYTPDRNPGIIDFQDTVAGPITYDLVSLLRDSYIAWSNPSVELWIKQFAELLLSYDLISKREKHYFPSWFYWVSLQRNLKVIGIFTRLALRDGKSQYLQNIPLTMSYAINVCRKFKQLAWLGEFLQNEVVTKFKEVSSTCVQ